MGGKDPARIQVLGMIPRPLATHTGWAKQAWPILQHWPNPCLLLNITRAPQGSAARRLYTANVWPCRCRHPEMCTPDQSRDAKAECLFSSFLSASRHSSKHGALRLCVPVGSICINTRVFLHAYTHASLMQSQIKNQYGNSTVETNVFT